MLAQEIAAGRLAPRVHAFFSQGRSVTLCLRSAATDEPHLSERSERTCSRCAEDGVDDVPAFPAVFCAACGQEYLVADAVDTEGGARLVPREFEATETDGDAVYVLPEALGEGHAAVPDEYVKKDGTARKGKEGGVPVEHVVCGRCGTLGGRVRARRGAATGRADPQAVPVLPVLRRAARRRARVQQVLAGGSRGPGHRHRCARQRVARRAARGARASSRVSWPSATTARTARSRPRTSTRSTAGCTCVARSTPGWRAPAPRSA